MLTMKCGNRQITKAIGETNQEKKRKRTLEEKETYKFLEILKADHIKQTEMKEKKIQENKKTTLK